MAIDDSGQELDPLYPSEDESTIRARWNAWANEGLTVDDVGLWVDTRPGSFFQMATQPGVQECAKIYDLMGTEVVSATMPIWAWGEYLDDIAEGDLIYRTAATAADGIVRFTAPAGTVIPSGTQVAVDGPTLDSEPKEYQTTALATVGVGDTYIDVAVEAVEAGSSGNTPAATVTVLTSFISGVTAITNPNPIEGGTDPETDEQLRLRISGGRGGTGPGNARDYVIWSLAYGGVGRVTVVPLWAGPGTVLVIALTADGGPVSTLVRDGLQAYLDPTAGQGGGVAPIGPTVTVATATTLNINVSQTIEFRSGYSLDGAGGTIALRTTIEAAIAEYMRSVPPGEEVNIRRIASRVLAITGVNDVGTVTLSGSGVTPLGNGNVALASNPAKVAALGTATLTAGTI